jgi:hypothetical protein
MAVLGMNTKKYIFLILLAMEISFYSFAQDYESNIFDFVIKGYGDSFITKKEIYGSDILSQFGGIINITIGKNFANQEYLKIEFASIYVELYEAEYIRIYKNKSITNDTFKAFRVRSITAKENIYYLFGIRVGMTYDEFTGIFGEVGNKYEKLLFDWETPVSRLSDVDQLVMLLYGEYMKYARIQFMGNRISRILWVL